jgi:hypothetical protein
LSILFDEHQLIFYIKKYIKMKTRLLTTIHTITQLITLYRSDFRGIGTQYFNVQCKGNNDGKIIISTTTTCAQPVSYSWAHGVSGSELEKPISNLHEVTITASDGFTIGKNCWITEPNVKSLW